MSAASPLLLSAIPVLGSALQPSAPMLATTMSQPKASMRPGHWTVSPASRGADAELEVRAGFRPNGWCDRWIPDIPLTVAQPLARDSPPTREVAPVAALDGRICRTSDRRGAGRTHAHADIVERGRAARGHQAPSGHRRPGRAEPSRAAQATASVDAWGAVSPPADCTSRCSAIRRPCPSTCTARRAP
jgi:hypothetical protein